MDELFEGLLEPLFEGIGDFIGEFLGDMFDGIADVFDLSGKLIWRMLEPVGNILDIGSDSLLFIELPIPAWRRRKQEKQAE